MMEKTGVQGAALDHTDAGIITVDLEGKVTWLNAPACRITGWSRVEAVGRDLERVYDTLCLETETMMSDWVQAVLETGEGHPLSIHRLLRSRTGTEAYVSDCLTVLRDDDGRQMGAVITFREISQSYEEWSGIAKREERLRLALKSASLGVWVLDLATNALIWDDRMFELYGVTRENFEGAYEAWLNGVHPEDRAKGNHLVMDAIEGKDEFHHQFRIVTPEGKVRWIEGHGSVTRDDSGKALSITGINRDISDTIWAMDNLRVSEERHRTLFELMHQGVCYLDGEGNLIHANPAAERILGKSLNDILSLEFDISKWAIHEDGSPFSSKDDPVSVALRTGEPVHNVVQGVIHANTGERIWINVNVVPLFRGGHDRPNQLFSTFEDITPQKKAELALRENQALLEDTGRMARVGGWEVDLATMSAKWTRETLRIHELPEDHKPDLEQAINFYHPDDRPRVVAVVKNAIAGTPQSLEARLITAKGKLIHTRATLNPSFEDGKVTRIYGSFQDITEQKRTEEELQKVQKLESLGTLAGGIAHDFNNILMGVFGNISMAKSNLPENDQAWVCLAEAESCMTRVTQLTRQLLTFAKGGEPIREDISLPSLVSEVVRFDLSGSNVRATFEASEDLWAAHVDKGQVQQVFSNLAINAKQAMPEGGHLTIEMRNQDAEPGNLLQIQPGKYIQVSVRDNGPGIPPDIRRRIFDPYFTTKETGSGLGLATAFSIVNRHGGHIGVESEIGAGTTFTIYLPAREAPVSEQVPESTPRERVQNNGRRILVMDDEPIIHKVTQAMLQMFGCDAHPVYDGKEAVAAYEEAMQKGHPFDLVIMDLTIPGGTGGRETVQKILELDPDATCVVSSGYADDPIMANFRSYGFKGVVAKPYALEDFKALMDSLFASVS